MMSNSNSITKLLIVNPESKYVVFLWFPEEKKENAIIYEIISMWEMFCAYGHAKKKNLATFPKGSYFHIEDNSS